MRCLQETEFYKKSLTALKKNPIEFLEIKKYTVTTATNSRDRFSSRFHRAEHIISELEGKSEKATHGANKDKG